MFLSSSAPIFSPFVFFSRLLPGFSFALSFFHPFDIYLRREGRRAASFFFFYICQAGKRDVGRDCSAKSAAAEHERKLLMNERQSFAVARCSRGHFTWMVSGCVRSSTAETKMLRCRRFYGDSWAFSVVLYPLFNDSCLWGRCQWFCIVAECRLFSPIRSVLPVFYKSGGIFLFKFFLLLFTDLIHFRMLAKNLRLNLVSFVFSQHGACLCIFCTEATRLVMSHRALKVHCWEPRVPSARSLRLI